MQVDQFLKTLGCKSVTAEPDLYFVALEDRLDGVIVTHVDVFYMAGTVSFRSQVAGSLMS